MSQLTQIHLFVHSWLVVEGVEGVEPQQWWKANQAKFPTLAMVRKRCWLA